ncbi:MAG: hypothetical protein K2P65_10755, partial [Lachnospiraceae bacterium]|nr:hypothetical protein [Lachnospiraceae bacterium]
MRKYLFWFWLMCKRMIKKKAFVLFLLLLPVMSVVITALEKQQDKDGKTGAVAGILWEGSFEEERQKADEPEQEGQAVSRTEQEGQAVGRTEQESQTVDEAEQEGQAVSRTKQE